MNAWMRSSRGRSRAPIQEVGGGGGESADQGADGVQLLDADPDAPKPPPKQAAGTGVDSGVGGLY